MDKVRLSVRVVWCLLISIYLVGPPLAMAQKKQQETKQKAQANPGDISSIVKVDKVRLEPLVQTIPVIGRLVARRAGAISSRIEGSVKAYNFEVGDRVDAGDVIALLDDETLRFQLEVAKGELAESNAQLVSKKAELELAKLLEKRLSRLQTGALTSKASLDDAHQKVIIARAAITEAEAAVLSESANVNLSKLYIKYTQVRSPYAGIVTKRYSEVGAYVRTGEALIDLLADHQLEVEADIPVNNLAGLEVGTQVTVVLRDQIHHLATVRAIIPQENQLTRTRAVRLVPDIQQSKQTLAANQSITVLVPIGKSRDVLSVHKDAVIKRRGKSLVYVVEDELALIRPVELGEAVGNRFEVLSGLKSGDQVVVRGNERLRPNDKVKIIGAITS